MVADAAQRIFNAHVPATGRAAMNEQEWVGMLWRDLELAGLTHPSLNVEHGGPGGGPHDERVIAELSGYYSTSAPVAETILGGLALASAGLKIPSGAVTFALCVSGVTIRMDAARGNVTLHGAASRVPWSDLTSHVVVIVKSLEGPAQVALIPTPAVRARLGENLAGENRVDLSFEAISLPVEQCAPSSLSFEYLHSRGALLRAAQIAGAADRALELSVDYANSRKQFGRAIGSFQAIQHQLAVLAEEAAAAKSAAAAAYDHVDRPDTFPLYAAIAKVRAAETARVVSAVAHQVHGAIGFCGDHALNFTTRRLMAWRSELGSEQSWAVSIGRAVQSAGPDGLWPLLVG
jgi:acyl-CoA dehydrogenase